MAAMEDKKTVFDYLGQVLQVFGFSILFLTVFSILFGTEAQGYSAIFLLGNSGLANATMLQFLLASVGTVALRFLFFTDTLIKNMTVIMRTVCMVLSEILMITGFICSCGWFPEDEWLPWVMFFLSFGICFVVSVGVTMCKERIENRMMQEALERLMAREAEKENAALCEKKAGERDKA